MLIQTGTVKGSKVGKNRDGESNVTLLQVELTEPEDIQTVEYLHRAGEDATPADGSTVVVITIGSAWRVAIACSDGIEPDMEKGERRIYSVSNGEVQAEIRLLATGVIEINGSADFAVAFNDMKTAFDQLKADLNSLQSTFALHTHPYTDTPIGASVTLITTTPGAASAADMSGAKVDTVKLP